jgi:hypothetical protein
MSDIKLAERLQLERALGMSSGYVGGFSNRTFEEFINEVTGLNIYEEKYGRNGHSKANRLRAFWELEPNFLVANLLTAMADQWDIVKEYSAPSESPAVLLQVAQRLRTDNPAAEVEDALRVAEGADFESLASAVRDAVEKGEPAAGLDRLHTYVSRLFRELCDQHTVTYTRDTALHSLVGGYIKAIRAKGLIESEMTDRILRTSISVMDAYNEVRNEKSYAHPNEVLNGDESKLIVSHVVATVRFIHAVESINSVRQLTGADKYADQDELPF